MNHLSFSNCFFQTLLQIRGRTSFCHSHPLRFLTQGLRFAAHRAAELDGCPPEEAFLGLPLSKRYRLSVVDRQRVPFLLAQERNQRRARGASPLRPQRRLRLAFGQSRRRPATDQRTSLQQPASRHAAGATPLPASPRNRIGRAFGGARPLLRGAQRPQGSGKLRSFAAQFSAGCPRRAIRCALLGAPAT